MQSIPTHTVHFPLYAYNAFEFHIWDTRPEVKVDEMLFEIIANWLAADKARLAALADKDSNHGVQWRELFLPHGTTLRTTVNSQDYYALVDGDCLICENERLTPSSFANRFGVSGRNAWKSIWVRFPAEFNWIRAATLRTTVLRRNSARDSDRTRTKSAGAHAIS